MASSMEPYTYVFAIGSMFALLEAYNNGASTFWSLFDLHSHGSIC